MYCIFHLHLLCPILQQYGVSYHLSYITFLLIPAIISVSSSLSFYINLYNHSNCPRVTNHHKMTILTYSPLFSQQLVHIELYFSHTISIQFLSHYIFSSQSTHISKPGRRQTFTIELHWKLYGDYYLLR